MAKQRKTSNRRKTLEKPELDLEVLHDAGYEISVDDLPWLAPLIEADGGLPIEADRGALIEVADKRLLENMLMACRTEDRAHMSPSPQVLYWIGEWLSRHEFKKKRGARQTPAYAISPDVPRLVAADERVRKLIASGKSVKEALDAVASETGIEEEALNLVHSKKHGSVNRALARLTAGRSARPSRRSL